MTDQIRVPFLGAAAAAFVGAFLIEVGQQVFLAGTPGEAGRDVLVVTNAAPPGRAMSALAILDVIVLLAIAVILGASIGARRMQARVQGPVTIAASAAVLVAALVATTRAIAELQVMLALFASPPFGTSTYLAIWGGFPRSAALVAVGTILAAKLAFCGLALAAHERFVANRGLVALTATSLVCTAAVAFAWNVVPGLLAAITDRIGAVVVGALAALWAVVTLVGALPAIVRSVRP